MPLAPLKDIRVLDLTNLPPGAYCTLMLADLGAEVIRVESPAAKGKRSLVIGQVGISRGKKSITLDTRNPASHDVLKRLVKNAHVIIENARPGSMEKAGFGYSHAADINPGIVWCSITGFGQDGVYASIPGHDISYLSQSGLLGTLAPDLPWHPAAMLAVPTGGLMAAMAVQSAIIQQMTTGKGCQIDISLAEAATWLLAGAPGALDGSSKGIPVTPDRRLYRCADGEFIAVAAAEPRTWQALCGALDAPDIAEALHKSDMADATTKRLAEVFITRPVSEWMEMLGGQGVAVMRVNRGAAIASDPHNLSRSNIVTVDGVAVPASPVRFRDRNGGRSGSATEKPHMVGADTSAVLASSGFSAEELERLEESGLI